MADEKPKLNAATMMMREQRDEFVRRLAEGIVHALGAASVTFLVTVQEPGAAKPTFVTLGFTCWGALLGQLPHEAQEAICREHFAASARAVEDQATKFEKGVELRHQEQESKEEDHA